MILRCDWCGATMGQVAPFDDMAPTHGICLACLDVLHDEIKDARERVTMLANDNDEVCGG